MHSDIVAAALFTDQALTHRIREFCALQGWTIDNQTALPDSKEGLGKFSQYDLVFVDDAALSEAVAARMLRGVVICLSDEVEHRLSPPEKQRLPVLELFLTPNVADHVLLDGITTALNLVRFQHQFFAREESEPITKLPHHTELLQVMSTYRNQPVGLLIVGVDHAEHLYANLDPVSKTDLLGALADHLQANLPHQALTGIYDAGCFAAWVPNVERGDIPRLAAAIHGCSQKPIQFRSGELTFTVSVGYGEETALVDPKELWQQVWDAKEKAQKQGGDRIFSSHLDSDLDKRIPQALDRNEFSLVLQPQYDIDGQTLRGAEALLRWQGLEVGNLFPEHFIPVAERSGQMARVGDWVLEHACCESATWIEQAATPITIGVNISPAQFHQGGILEQVERLSRDQWLNPASLELEMSHEDLLHVVDQHRTTLYQLRDMGVRVAIDNLGQSVVDTNKLLRCPADTLKIDRTLISRIDSEAHAQTLVDQICQLAARFSLRTVAVGVESERQRQMLTAMGCVQAQGFLFAAPVPLEAFQSFLTAASNTRSA